MAEIANIRLKTVFYLHFILIVWVTMGRWCPLSYLFYNTMLALILLWGLHANDSSEPIQLAVIVNATSILFDVILLSLRYPGSNSGSGEHFSAAMAIFNLVLRPFSTIILYRILQDRNGNIGPLESVASAFHGGNSRSPSGYDDMDKHQSVPTTSQADEFFPRQI